MWCKKQLELNYSPTGGVLIEAGTRPSCWRRMAPSLLLICATLDLTFSTVKAFWYINFAFSINALFLYTHSIVEKEIDVKPSVLISYKQNAPILYDVNLQAFWKRMFWIGIGYRSRPGIILSAGVSFDKLSISYASELGVEKYANMFNQIHEIGVTYSFAKRKKIPNDTLIVPPIEVLANKDSVRDATFLNLDPLKVDGISDEETDVSYLEEELDSKYEISEIGEGIYVVKPVSDEDLNYDATALSNYFETISEQDSTLVRDLVNHIEEEEKPDDYELIEVGDGVFTIKQKQNNTDTANFEAEFSEEMLDSLIQESNFFNKDEKAADIRAKATYYHSEYYTVQLFINESNKVLLNNAEIVDMARIERSKDGRVKYYYGYFSRKSEAERHQKRLSKFDLKTKVLKFESYQ